MRRNFIFALFFLLAISFVPTLVLAENLDTDNDGLSDELELKFGTDINNSDSDSDGYTDGVEVKNGFDPLHGDGAWLARQIKINLAKQKLSYLLGGVELGEFSVSTGKKSMPTPKGTFLVANKNPKAWSATYKLWMPYWLGFKGKNFGIHELPVWPSGYREGASHLGTPVSHGCVRLGIGPAKIIYDFAVIGTEVKIE